MRPALLTLFALTATAAVAQSARDGEGWQALPAALAVAHAERTPALVYIQAAWCGPCRRLEAETFTDPAVRARLDRLARARLDLDDRDRVHRVGPYRLSEAEWSARLGAEATPTLVFLAPDGAVLGHHTGFLPPSGLLPLLDAALAAPAR